MSGAKNGDMMLSDVPVERVLREYAIAVLQLGVMREMNMKLQAEVMRQGTAMAAMEEERKAIQKELEAFRMTAQ